MTSTRSWSDHQNVVRTRTRRDPADLLQLIEQVTWQGYLNKAKQKFDPDDLMQLLDEVVGMNLNGYLERWRSELLDTLSAQARDVDIRRFAQKEGGTDPTPSPDDGLDGQNWTLNERAVLSRCKRAASTDPNVSAPQSPLRADDREELLRIIARVYLRGHSSAKRQLVKSTGITRAIRLLSSEELFPPTLGEDGEPGPTMLIDARVRLLSSICKDSPQRPVADAAGLALLEQQLEEDWASSSPDLVPWALEATTEAREQVLSLNEIARQLKPGVAAELDERLQKAPFRDKRMRMNELVDVLDTHGDTPGVGAIAEHALGLIFEGLEPSLKTSLVNSLFKSLERSNATSRDGWLKYVLEPVILQNATNPRVQTRLIDLISTFEPEEREPYMLFHFDAMRSFDMLRTDRRAIDYAKDHGTRAFAARLYPLTEFTTGGFFVRPTPLAEHAKTALDALIEREGLGDAAGSLSVAQGVGGELSVAVATEGALSLGGAMLPVDHDAGAMTPTLTELEPPTQATLGENPMVIAFLVSLVVIGLMVVGNLIMQALAAT